MKHRILTIVLTTIALVSIALPASAQQENADIRRGNRAFDKQDYTTAEVNYRRALEANPNSFEATYNLANALMRQDKPADAEKLYQRACTLVDKQKEPLRMAHLYHNLGNSQYAQQNFGGAIESYKKSLRLNPKDNDTRYNLVKAMQQKQQQDKQQQQQDQQQQEQQQQQKQDKSQMDQQTAEQLLQALEQDEQKTQEKTQKHQSKTRNIDKDW